MKIKDLIGHKILDISDSVEFLIKTDKGVYQLNTNTFPDGSLSDVDVEESSEDTWDMWVK